MGSLHQDAAWDCYPGVCDQGQGHLLKIEIQFLLNNFSSLWPIDTKPSVWVAYIKTQLGIAYQVTLIKVKVTITKNRNSIVSATTHTLHKSVIAYGEKFD